ncbi:hemagluttinin family protein [Burkholderia thailandensis USAMRU Malaysia |nr:hemagluttinin family protein [Burkholderia thailandensis 2002721723]AHI82657.1 hemagluttinin family protein [Burkholderia thailandensis E444]AIC89642.1 hemagluttinin family protein [Burkholderia thailandensis USAMRU Malaysia \
MPPARCAPPSPARQASRRRRLHATSAARSAAATASERPIRARLRSLSLAAPATFRLGRLAPPAAFAQSNSVMCANCNLSSGLSSANNSLTSLSTVASSSISTAQSGVNSLSTGLSTTIANSANNVIHSLPASTNVAADTEGTGAVNVNPLNALPTSMSQSLTGQQTRINSLGSPLPQTQPALQRTDSMARQGIAAATALTILTQVEPGKTINVAVGVACFAGQSWMAFGRART